MKHLLFQNINEWLIDNEEAKPIFEEYQTLETLTVPTRQLLVRLVVDTLIREFGKPNKDIKIAAAKSIIECFPGLRDQYAKEGYVSIFFLAVFFFIQRTQYFYYYE